MPNTFEVKKHKILSQLAIPDHEYMDLSPKGSVDKDIRGLVGEINAQRGFVTTSSCAGRIAVFLEGQKKSTGKHEAIGGAGGKGGGEWLFVSHEPVDPSSHSAGDGSLFSLFGMQKGHQENDSPAEIEGDQRLVHFKFEPMILHILSSSLSDAQHALTAGMSAGFRESGISGVGGSAPTPLVAVRTAGLAFDSIIGYQAMGGSIAPLVSEEYLRTLVRIANERFTINADRRERFRTALVAGNHSDNTAMSDEWEPTDIRRLRKREEGLRKKNAKLRDHAAASSSDNVHEDDDCGFKGEEFSLETHS